MKHLALLTALNMLSGMLLLPVVSHAQESDASRATTARVDFAKEVRPIFAEHCHACHGAELQESNFRLDMRSKAFGVGDFEEPPIIPGSSAKSPLIAFVSSTDKSDVMPPAEGSEPLTRKQIDILRRWIDQGADWPDEYAGDANAELVTDHWSFQPLGRPDEPAIESPWIQNGIDAFVLRKLRQQGLEPSGKADRLTFARRIFLDMHGMPPSIARVQAFANDGSSQAYDRLIDDVLKSHHYGERWARHWLDVARFGESTGFEVNRDRPSAYHYRDYVIRALNDDISYRDFIIEQLAGDAVGVDAGTGFLVGGPYDMVKSPDINLTLMQRQDELADIVNTTGTAFLGLTLGCARCHNHKFDPILQKDYYAFQAAFAGVQHGERKLRGSIAPAMQARLTRLEGETQKAEEELEKYRAAASGPKSSEKSELLPAVNASKNVEEFAAVRARFIRFTILASNASEPCIDELEIYAVGSDKNVALASFGTVATSSGNLPNHPIHRLAHINDGQYGNARSWISNTAGSGWVQLELPGSISINRIVWSRDRQNQFRDRIATNYQIEVATEPGQWQTVASSALREPLSVGDQVSDDAFLARLGDLQATQARKVLTQIKDLRSELTELAQSVSVAYVGTFQEPPKTYRLYRGEPTAPREEVVADVLTVSGSLGLKSDTPEQQRRLAVAKWIASADNPLTARVIVNRVWHYHFGSGIVSTPSDFGKNGTPPSHPQLLDWLASEFIDNGWSLKWLHREILSSSTYQQASLPRTKPLAKDGESRLLWRFPPRRLEAEAIRDCVLHASGALNLQAGGPGFSLFEINHENVHHYFPKENFGPNEFRRMIYMLKIRQEQDEVFGIFDCPDGAQVVPNRSRSTTPLQALNLLNSRFMLQQADLLAGRVQEEASPDVTSQVNRVFQRVLTRDPDDAERRDAAKLVEQFGLDALCRAMLNANEFLFLR